MNYPPESFERSYSDFSGIVFFLKALFDSV
jgi:hypothetical protein